MPNRGFLYPIQLASLLYAAKLQCKQTGKIMNKQWETHGSRAMKLESTPPKINMEPENDGLEDDFPLPGGPYCQVPC